MVCWTAGRPDDLLGVDVLQAHTHRSQNGGIRQDIVELDAGGERVTNKDSIVEVGAGDPIALGQGLAELRHWGLRLGRARLRRGLRLRGGLALRGCGPGIGVERIGIVLILPFLPGKGDEQGQNRDPHQNNDHRDKHITGTAGAPYRPGSSLIWHIKTPYKLREKLSSYYPHIIHHISGGSSWGCHCL